MTATLRKQIERSNRKARGEKRVEVYLTREEQRLLGDAPAQALKDLLADKLKAELEK